MKKLLLVLVSVLLLSGVANAVEMNQAVTAELAAQNISRSVTTDSSVILNVWSGGVATNPGVGVSANSLLKIYTNYVSEAAIVLDLKSTSFDTVGEVVDYINTNFNSDSTVKLYASVGRDAHRSMVTTSAYAGDIVAAGVTKATGASVKNASSTKMSAGVEAVADVTPRLKSISAQIPAKAMGVLLRVYDNDTLVWTRYVGTSAYISSSSPAASPNTVDMPGRGLSVTKGNALCVTATADGNIDPDTVAKATNNISIIYDNLRD